MARLDVAPTTEERAFGIDELFFSTTNPKGHIIAGNRVFARVSGWPAAELTGKPHNILRHPDMPRVAFKHVWDELNAGRPIVAYVKNKARTGAYYWVVASIVPVDGGFLSVRFKPSSAIFETVKGLYAQLLAVETEIEQNGGTRAEAMTASQAALGTALKSLGFASYQDFMLAFVPEELRCRDAGMQRHSDHHDAAVIKGAAVSADLLLIDRDISEVGAFLQTEFSQLGAFIALGETLVGKAEFVRGLAQNVRLISQNVSISSRRRELAGRPLAVVGDTMRDLADRVGVVTTGLTQRIHNLSAELRDQAFRISMVRLQAQTAHAFVVEISTPPDGSVDEAPVGRVCESIAALTHCVMAQADSLFSAYRAIAASLRKVRQEALQLEDQLRTLNMVRLTGRVEVSRLTDPGEFEVLFDTIEKELGAANTQLLELGTAMESIGEATARGHAQESDLLARLKRAGEAVLRVDAAERRQA